MTEEQKLYENETVLADDYPVYPGYAYVMDGVAMASDIRGNVRDLKAKHGYNEIRRCNIVARGIKSFR